MTWQAHNPHLRVADSRMFYTYTVETPDIGEYYCAYIVETDEGFRATVHNPPVVMPRGNARPPPYHYTHDTLQEAKDWCVVELVKRRLDT